MRRVDLFHDLHLKMRIVLVSLRNFNNLLYNMTVIFGTDAYIRERIVVIDRFDHLPLLEVFLHYLYKFRVSLACI